MAISRKFDPDGRFSMIRPDETATPADFTAPLDQIRVVVNGFEFLEDRAPVP